MAKRRQVHPEIWTDEKFVALDPLARLLFIGMWNHACDNGHLDDSAIQLKMRILPADSCDVSDLLEQLVDSGMVDRRDGCLKVVNLAEKQALDLRYLVFCDHCDTDPGRHYTDEDKPGKRRATKGSPTSAPRAHHGDSQGAPRSGDGDGDGDGDGGKPRSRDTRATRIDPDFAITDDMRQWAKDKSLDHLDLDGITENFVDYWLGKSGKDATKVDWLATWRGWVRRERGFRGERNNVARIEPRKGMPPEPCKTCGAPPEHGHYDGCPVAS